MRNSVDKFYLQNIESKIKIKGFLTGWIANYIQRIVQSREWFLVASWKVQSYVLSKILKTSDWIKKKKYTYFFKKGGGNKWMNEWMTQVCRGQSIKSNASNNPDRTEQQTESKNFILRECQTNRERQTTNCTCTDKKGTDRIEQQDLRRKTLWAQRESQNETIAPKATPSWDTLVRASFQNDGGLGSISSAALSPSACPGAGAQ